MGLFDGLMKAKYPALPEDAAAARAIAAKPEFEAFAKSANDKMEVVPGTEALYVYVGNPPKAFGLVWFEDGARLDVRSLLGDGSLAPEPAAALTRRIREIYESYGEAARFEHRVGGHRLTVTPSDEMYRELREAVETAMA